jgi:hypothetical protein
MKENPLPAEKRQESQEGRVVKGMKPVPMTIKSVDSEVKFLLNCK